MSKPAAIFLILYVLAIVCYSTWQMFKGDLEAAFSALPFLILAYLFVKPWKRQLTP